MQQYHVTAIYRATRYSKDLAEKDASILHAVCEQLVRRQCILHGESEEHLEQTGWLDNAPVFLMMGRSPRVLDLLAGHERKGAVVVNAPRSIRLCCQRSRLSKTLQSVAGIPLPTLQPLEDSPKGYWLKRGDGPAVSVDDVVYAPTREELLVQMDRFRQRGITEWDVQRHVEGRVVKFYGVEGTGFFRAYAAEGAEVSTLQRIAEAAARATGVIVYGGDAVVSADGVFLIDFNDWPSFSPCKDEAASAIAERICSLLP